MKHIMLIGFLLSGMLFIATGNVNAQPPKKVVVVHKGHAKKAQPKKVVVIHKSKYRPAKVTVFHPAWGPKKAFHHRWVYFPKHNCYWDNWRNVYFYKTPKGWVSSPKKPTVIVNINLDNEKHYELSEADDENDEIYTSNEEHIKEYK